MKKWGEKCDWRIEKVGKNMRLKNDTLGQLGKCERTQWDGFRVLENKNVR